MREDFSDSPSKEEAASVCEDIVFEAVESQIESDTTAPTLVEAIPTIGKTTAAAKFASELIESERNIGVTYLTHRTNNRKQFAEKVQEFASDEDLVNPVHLPVLEDDCPTANGEHGNDWSDRLTSLRDQGLSPSTLHKNTQFSLPCGGTDCPYMEWWNNAERDDLILGHLSHAYAPEVIGDRIVIVDEDPGDAFQTRFDAGDMHDFVQSFFSQMDDPPVSNLDGLKQIAGGNGVFEEAREQLYQYASEIEYFELGKQILREREGHIQAANAVRALLEPEVGQPNQVDSYRITLSNGVEHSRLEDNIVTAYDPSTGQLAIRRTPDFSLATAVVALDGTPTKKLWKGRLGVDEINHVKVLSDECRREYLEDVLGYSLYQTTRYIKPYSGASGDRISFEKDRGLLHEIFRKSSGDVGLITTKKAKSMLLGHDDGNTINIEDSHHNHYRNIRGSNEFEGDEIRTGVVIGSPHPGPNELRIVAGLNGDAYESNTVEINESSHQYTRREPTEESRPYLEHFRENSVAQAALRFGRMDGATVFIHTAAIPAWMKTSVTEIEGKVRSKGEQEVIETIRDIDEATTTEVAEQTDVTINTVRNHLKSLESEGLVSKEGNQHRFIWKISDEINGISPTFKIELPPIDH